MEKAEEIKQRERLDRMQKILAQLARQENALSELLENEQDSEGRKK